MVVLKKYGAVRWNVSPMLNGKSSPSKTGTYTVARGTVAAPVGNALSRFGNVGNSGSPCRRSIVVWPTGPMFDSRLISDDSSVS